MLNKITSKIRIIFFLLMAVTNYFLNLIVAGIKVPSIWCILCLLFAGLDLILFKKCGGNKNG